MRPTLAPRAVAILAVMVTAGCATQTYTLDEWRSAAEHRFANTTPSRFEKALERVFDESRPRDYALRPHGDGIIVERHWSEYAVVAYASGIEHWDISYRNDGGDLVARADLVTVESASWPPGVNAIPLRPDSPSTYQLLWDRVAYVLGQQIDWPSCEHYRGQLAPHSMDRVRELGLCGYGAPDGPPPPKPL